MITDHCRVMFVTFRSRSGFDSRQHEGAWEGVDMTRDEIDAANAARGEEMVESTGIVQYASAGGSGAGEAGYANPGYRYPFYRT